MSSSRGPYKSRLFTNLNRQSQRLRDRLGETVRHLRVAAEWGVQALIYPFYWLLHPEKWLGPVLGSGGNQHQRVLPAGKDGDKVNSGDRGDLAIAVDQPIETVLTSLQAWFDHAEVEQTGQGLVLVQDFSALVNHQSPGENIVSVHNQDLALPGQPEKPALPPSAHPSLLAKLGEQVKSIFQTDNNAIVIQGLASRCGDRRLVLTTKDNLTLDVFSSEQQQQLQQQIRRELAQWHYQRRRQWALQAQNWRGIPLITGKSDQSGDLERQPRVIAPLDWLWQGIYRWQTRPPLTTLGQSTGAIIPTAVSTPDLNGLKHWLTQTATTLGQQPVIEATVVKSQQLSQQIVEVLPPTVQHLGQGLQHRVQQTLEQLFNSDRHPVNGPDPFELKVILQAAIAYFFGPQRSGSAQSLAGEGGNNPVLPGENSSPWLAWEELFADLPMPAMVTPLLGQGNGSATTAHTVEQWTEESIENPHNFALVPGNNSPAIAPNRRGRKHPGRKQSALVNSVFPSPPGMVAQDPWLEEDWALDELEEKVVSAQGETKPQGKSLHSTGQMAHQRRSPQELETAFDWIETQAQSLGYDKHVLVWCLEWLDRLVYGLEQLLGKIWQWLRQKFGQTTGGADVLPPSS
ncbi:sll1858 [Synechocystis sp. PCC 6803]|uniref:Sll1858 protein n=1 Tax=Synechocystis sp. (strain ATCC 27184 / PCC 6803 / Kazusa) TaxID=1111708 RepID=P74489_SYNY3|nr:MULTISPECIES: hypothetical protein [unclassified Synechocystis]BAM54678.1 hypothetical protein BEST7613_5747 [Synechocystis sp. PCC 6803] [Bacillus subtilis BEST7613]AGF52279.1 hypothetical protein MYO_120380 [Synechocystis sp. PCC 6803]ALJ68223.1 hypothetical protein AOY38_10500 [Synechocystis sp. PCC 6803]AVP90065.1 hypothetical protein C7I86_10540 [Synechocystis sp. IPPAS B-1465]MBD2620109.1 hypothetical protein [Synechocystis sp. FACHB-898]